MKAPLFRIGCMSFALALAAACATSGNNDESPPPPQGDDGGNPVLTSDGGADGAAEADAGLLDASEQTCSEAGWCLAPLPNPNTVLMDVWPVEGHAFAITNSNDSVGAPQGINILEWDDAVGHWNYIDDNSQNNIGPSTSTNIWAPNADEVYFAVLVNTTTPPVSYLYHGKRPAAPATTWSWARTDFPCPTLDTFPEVWGSSATDLYFWTCQTIYHLTSDPGDGGAEAGSDGGPTWVPEYVDDTPSSPVNLFGMAGTGPDDVWFVGSRGFWLLGGCSTIVRKTAAGYQRIVDTAAGFFDCSEIPGVPFISGSLASDLGLGSYFAPSKGRLIGVRHDLDNGNDLVRIDADDDGGVAVSVSAPATTGSRFSTVWGTSDDNLLVVADISDISFVVQGKNLWNDAGTYEKSTLVRNGLPNLSELFRIRGSSNTNVWAVGDGHAYHKTTP